jgi:hypothetical protein
VLKGVGGGVDGGCGVNSLISLSLSLSLSHTHTQLKMDSLLEKYIIWTPNPNAPNPSPKHTSLLLPLPASSNSTLSPPCPLPSTPNPLFIITSTIDKRLRDLARVITSGYPVLLQGPTSSGKTSMVEYVAQLTGHRFVRVNNHEHTDLQEYMGSYGECLLCCLLCCLIVLRWQVMVFDDSHDVKVGGGGGEILIHY